MRFDFIIKSQCHTELVEVFINQSATVLRLTINHLILQPTLRVIYYFPIK